jgi:hypothetical protein
MTDGSGPRSSEPFASLGPDGWSLRTHQLCWDSTTGEPSAESSPRWPKQGMTRGGDAYELAMSELPIGASGSSSLLATPSTANAAGYAKDPAKVAALSSGGHRRGHQGNELQRQIDRLLPTPSATYSHEQDPATFLDHRERVKEATGNGNGFGLSLGMAIQLLPTPTVGDAKSARNSTAQRNVLPPTGIHAGDTLTDVLVPRLLPTPTARCGDESGRGADPDRYRGPKSLGGRRVNLDDATAAILDGRFPSTGASTPPPSTDGPDCSAPPLPLWTSEDDSRPSS